MKLPPNAHEIIAQTEKRVVEFYERELPGISGVRPEVTVRYAVVFRGNITVRLNAHWPGVKTDGR